MSNQDGDQLKKNGLLRVNLRISSPSFRFFVTHWAPQPSRNQRRQSPKCLNEKPQRHQRTKFPEAGNANRSLSRSLVLIGQLWMKIEATTAMMKRKTERRWSKLSNASRRHYIYIIVPALYYIKLYSYIGLLGNRELIYIKTILILMMQKYFFKQVFFSPKTSTSSHPLKTSLL